MLLGVVVCLGGVANVNPDTQCRWRCVGICCTRTCIGSTKLRQRHVAASGICLRGIAWCLAVCRGLDGHGPISALAAGRAAGPGRRCRAPRCHGWSALRSAAVPCRHPGFGRVLERAHHGTSHGRGRWRRAARETPRREPWRALGSLESLQGQRGHDAAAGRPGRGHWALRLLLLLALRPALRLRGPRGAAAGRARAARFGLRPRLRLLLPGRPVRVDGEVLDAAVQDLRPLLRHPDVEERRAGAAAALQPLWPLPRGRGSGRRLCVRRACGFHHRAEARVQHPPNPDTLPNLLLVLGGRYVCRPQDNLRGTKSRGR
mmetsp:Transcript_16029/g.46726  ORF Transcript_16029/g.46726 Transcript_16029/m.46726 type:complete len:317 (-) Transcript_16029:183-1133(-)